MKYIKLMRDPMVAAGLNFLGGQIMGDINDDRQFRQNERNQRLQIKGQKEMGIFNQNLARQMWEDTGYVAQVEQMERAGLSKGLMYKGNGASGQTTVTPGNVSAGQGRNTGGENQDILGMMMADAQIENLQADTKLKTANANKTAGVDTEKGKAEIGLIQVNTELNKLNLNMEQRTLEDKVAMIATEAIISQEKAWQEGNNTHIKAETMQAEIDKIKAEAINTAIEGDLIRKEIELGTAQIEKMAADIVQRAQEIMIKKGHLDNETLIREFETDWGNIIGKEAVSVVGGILQSAPIMGLLKRGKGTTTTTTESTERYRGNTYKNTKTTTTPNK